MSLPDTVFIFVLALIIFGPKKLPEIGRQIGRLVGEFRRASNEFKFQIEEELRQADITEKRSQPEISKPAAEAAPDKDSVAALPLSDEPTDPAEILPVGQHPNIDTLDASKLDAAEAPSSGFNDSSLQAEVPESASETPAGETLSSTPLRIEITAAPGSQPRTTAPFTSSAPTADPFSQESPQPSLEPVVPASRPSSRAEAEVTHG